jgi:hypothetical protein
MPVDASAYLTSGLPDNFDGPMTDCRFGFNPDYNNGQTLLLLHNKVSTDDDVGTLDGEQYTVNKGFESREKGTFVEREDGSGKGFHESSGMGTLLSAIAKLDGIEETWDARIAEGLTPLHAAFYEGMSFHWERQTLREGTAYESHMLIPTAFVGSGDVVKPKAPRTKKAAAKKKAKKAAAPKTEPEGPDLDEVRTQVRAIADTCDTVEEFAERAYSEIEGLEDNADWQALVDDTDSEGSVWVEAVEAAEE